MVCVLTGVQTCETAERGEDGGGEGRMVMSEERRKGEEDGGWEEYRERGWGVGILKRSAQ